MKKIALLVALLAIVGTVSAVGTQLTGIYNGDLVLSKTGWTIGGVAQPFGGMPYELNGDVYIQTGSITMDAGVVLIGFQPNISALIICRDADIFVDGTKAEPVIMTSAEDVATWFGSVVVRAVAPVVQIPDGSGIVGNNIYPVISITTMGSPETGKARIACNEWGTLVVLGKGYISSNIVQSGNKKYPDATNLDVMEGLRVGNPVGVTTAMCSYGGGDDNDDSGSIQYLSLRYGGRTDVPTKELNGMSLGGVGRGTDMHYVEIFSNLDDGIEIWGGTVELDHIVMWNVGDDNLDLDQGWRGKVSYGLCVQGFSKAGTAAASGSGGGDNLFEMDGAEDSDVQPVTTCVISNFTVIGDPMAGDHATAWRDNNRAQFHDCIFMDIADNLVKNDNTSGTGDGDHGYGFNGTLTFAETWTTDYSEMWNLANIKTGGHANIQLPLGPGFTEAQLQALYPAQTSGKLAEMTNCVFYNVRVYTDAIAVGVLADGTTMDAPNGTKGNIIKSTRPIKQLDRLPAAAAPTLYAVVKRINPLPVSGVTAGAFSTCNWLADWTAAATYGLTDTSDNSSSGDMDCDGGVGMSDLSIFSSQWLR